MILPILLHRTRPRDPCKEVARLAFSLVGLHELVQLLLVAPHELGHLTRQGPDRWIRDQCPELSCSGPVPTHFCRVLVDVEGGQSLHAGLLHHLLVLFHVHLTQGEVGYSSIYMHMED